MAILNFDVTGTCAISDSAVNSLLAAFTVSDTMAITDSLAINQILLLALVDDVGIAGAIGFAGIKTLELEDNAGIATVLGLNAIMGMDLANAMQVAVVIQAGKEQYTGWIVNPSLAASAGLSGFDFNSFARCKGKSYAIGPGGIYKLGGDKDAGADIKAFIGLPKLTFGSAQQKRVPHAYIGVASTGHMIMRVLVDNQTFTYVARNTTPTMGQQRIDTGKGLKGSYWQFELMNEDGADFDIDTIRFMPIVLERRL
jgi:hypothetical protein